MEISAASQEWYICFYDISEGMFSHFLPKNNRYRHVGLFFKRELGWYYISPHPNYTYFHELKAMASSKVDNHIFKMGNCFQWIKVKVHNPWCKTMLITIPTCVDTVIRLMGIKLGLCFSVKGLYNNLIRFNNKTNYTIIEIRETT